VADADFVDVEVELCSKPLAAHAAMTARGAARVAPNV
jgi:hypothetical protein